MKEDYGVGRCWKELIDQKVESTLACLNPGLFTRAECSRQEVPEGRNLHVMTEEDRRVDGRRHE